jgi:hypothetical protein
MQKSSFPDNLIPVEFSSKFGSLIKSVLGGFDQAAIVRHVATALNAPVDGSVSLRRQGVTEGFWQTRPSLEILARHGLKAPSSVDAYVFSALSAFPAFTVRHSLFGVRCLAFGVRGASKCERTVSICILRRDAKRGRFAY